MNDTDIITSVWNHYLATAPRPPDQITGLSATVDVLMATAKTLAELLAATTPPITDVKRVNDMLAKTAAMQTAFAQVGQAVEDLREADRQWVKSAAVIDQEGCRTKALQRQQSDAGLIAGLDTGVGSLVSAGNALLIGDTQG